MKSRLNITVFIGEHESWLDSASFLFREADSKKYNLKPVFFDKDGLKFYNGYFKTALQDAPPLRIKSWLASVRQKTKSEKVTEVLRRLGTEEIGFGFVLAQKFYGADMKIQEFLHKAGVPYNGSHFRAAQLATAKDKIGQFLKKKGFLTPREILISQTEWHSRRRKIVRKIKNDFILPIIIKPASAGESLGVNLVEDLGQLAGVFSEAFFYGDKVLVQEYLKGTEISCAVLDDGKGRLKALPPLIIKPLRSCRFFNHFSKKYLGRCQFLKFPGPPDLMEKIKFSVARAHQVLNLSGVSRADIILSGRKIYFLEINPLPGLSQASILPHSATLVGIGAKKLIDFIIRAGFNRFLKEKK